MIIRLSQFFTSGSGIYIFLCFILNVYVILCALVRQNKVTCITNKNDINITFVSNSVPR